MNLGEALFLAKGKLLRCAVPSPSLNAEVLLQRLLREEKVYLWAHPERTLSAEEERQYFEWVERRCQGEPAQYITGWQEFWGMGFQVTPEVLIPRPETEHVVETVLKLNSASAPVIVDVGTGSGCIAVALAKELPQARIYAVDKSKPALLIAARNAEAQGLNSHIEWAWSDLLSYFELEGFQEGFDFVVSNPPYVPRTDRHGLPREVRLYEPATALHSAHEDAVEVYRRLISQALPRLRCGGFLVVEIGEGQEAGLRSLFDPSAWSDINSICDLQGIPRVLQARKTIAASARISA